MDGHPFTMTLHCTGRCARAVQTAVTQQAPGPGTHVENMQSMAGKGQAVHGGVRTKKSWPGFAMMSTSGSARQSSWLPASASAGAAPCRPVTG